MSATWTLPYWLFGVIWLIVSIVCWAEASHHGSHRTPRAQMIFSLGWPVYALWYLILFWPWNHFLRPLLTNEWYKRHD